MEFSALTTIPLVFGTISQSTGKRGDLFYYKWLAFVKSPYNHDLSCIIDNVKFILHETYENSVRSKFKSVH